MFFFRKLWQKVLSVDPEALAVDDPVSTTVVIRTIFFCFGKYRVILDQSRASHPLLVFNGIKDFVDREPQRSEVLFHLESLG